MCVCPCPPLFFFFFFFLSLPLSLLLLYLFLPLIKKGGWKKDITVLAGSLSLPVPPSWQLANPAREEDAQPGHGVNPMQQKWGSSWRCQRMGGVPTTDPAMTWECPWNGYSSNLAAWLDGEGATGRGPGSQQRLCHAKAFLLRGQGGWRHRPRAAGTQGLFQPPKGGGSSQSRATSTAFTAKFGAAEMLCLSLPTCICVRARIICASLGWNACSWKDVWAPSEVRGAAGTPHLQTQAPRQKGSTQELASGIFFFF